jgi:hypothetical protein
MKRIQNFVMLLALVAGVLVSCQKEKSLETGNTLPPVTVPPPPPGNGQLMLWAKQACTGTKLVAEVNGQQDTITAFQLAIPSCGAPGTAFFTLSPGDYTWKAYCEGTIDTIRGSVTITAGSCAANEIIFGTVVNSSFCKLSNIAGYDLAAAYPLNAITSFYNALNQVSRTRLIDSTTGGGTILNEFNLSYTTSQINIDAKQYFTLEPGGRISQFHGYIDPTDNTSPEVIISYLYNPLGYMSKSMLALKAQPATTLIDYTYTWISNNLVGVEGKDITGAKTLVQYQYDPANQAKNFLCLLPNAEILLFQNAINFGKNSANLPVKSTWTDYKADNTIDGAAAVSEFKNYTYDANNNIKTVDIIGNNPLYGSDIKYILSYKCF